MFLAVLWMVLLSLCCCCSNAFQAFPISSSKNVNTRKMFRQMIVLQSSNTNNDNQQRTTATTKSKNPQKRKPRFTQQVFKESDAPPQSQQQRSQKNGKSNNSRSKNGVVQKAPPPALPDFLSEGPSVAPYSKNSSSNKKQKASSSPTSTTTTRAPFIRPDAPWNSGKSMEELESEMIKKWGTDASRWSAAGGSNKDFDEDENYDEDDFEIVYEEDEDDDDVSTGKINNKQTKNTRTPVVKASNEDQDGFFFRKSSKQQQPEQQDVYNDNNNNNGVSDGRLEARTKPDQRPEAEPEEGGFFFRKQSPPEQRDTATAATAAAAAPARREKQPKPEQLPFVKDENGNPLLLTLAQAQTNFDVMVAQDAQVDDTDEANDDKDTPSPKSWQDLGITSPILSRLERMQCSSPLAVQEKACPSVMEGKDVLVGTYTGSGKTLAFLVPLMERILFRGDDNDNNNNSLQILIVVPGRELASQVVSVARELLEGTGMLAMLAIGGTGFSRNLEEIRKKKPSLIVGTPGRIAELIVGKPGERYDYDFFLSVVLFSVVSCVSFVASVVKLLC